MNLPEPFAKSRWLGDPALYSKEQVIAAIQEAVLAERLAAQERVKAVSAGLLNCDINGSPVDEYIAKWKAISAVGGVE